jgi:hypothetical protein
VAPLKKIQTNWRKAQDVSKQLSPSKERNGWGNQIRGEKERLGRTAPEPRLFLVAD